jgi:hypothetical protein
LINILITLPAILQLLWFPEPVMLFQEGQFIVKAYIVCTKPAMQVQHIVPAPAMLLGELLFEE